MPMKPGLELMAVICTDRFYFERKFLNHIIDEIDRTFLRVPRIDFERSNTGAIIDSCVLEALDSLAVLIVKN